MRGVFAGVLLIIVAALLKDLNILPHTMVVCAVLGIATAVISLFSEVL